MGAVTYSKFYGEGLNREKFESLTARCRPLIMTSTDEPAVSALKLIISAIYSNSKLEQFKK